VVRAWLSKGFTGKFLIAENSVFENKLNNSPNNENLNGELACKSIASGLPIRHQPEGVVAKKLLLGAQDLRTGLGCM